MHDAAKLQRLTAALGAASLAIEALQMREHSSPASYAASSSAKPSPSSEGSLTAGIDGRHRSAPAAVVQHASAGARVSSEEGENKMEVTSCTSEARSAISSEPHEVDAAIGRHHSRPHHHISDRAGPVETATISRKPLLSWLSRLEQLQNRDRGLKSAKTVSMLKQVLETFTDVTRYPR